MSRLFEKFIDHVFGNNPYAYEEYLQRKLDAEYQEWCYDIDKWRSGKRTPENTSLKEWEYLNKPTKDKR